MLKKIKKKLFLFFTTHFFGKQSLFVFFKKILIFSLKGMQFISEPQSLKKNLTRFLTLYPQNKSSRPRVILDVGAGTGASTMQLITTLGPSPTVIAIEPSTHAFKSLCSLFQANKHVSCYQTALGKSKKKTVLFQDINQFHSEKSSLHPNSILPTQRQTEEVDQTTLDLFCHEHTLPYIEIIHLECNGAELNILEGASTLLSENRIRTILFTYGERNRGTDGCFQALYAKLNDRYIVELLLENGQIPVKESDLPLHEFCIGKRYYCATLKPGLYVYE